MRRPAHAAQSPICRPPARCARVAAGHGIGRSVAAGKSTRGFSLVELMVAMVLGLILLAGVLAVFMSQRQVYNSATSLGTIQNAENALSAMLTPAIRGAGYAGCATFTGSNTIIASSPASLPYDFTAPLFGYDAAGTAGAGNVNLTTPNPPNDSNLTDWNPVLDASLAGMSEPGSDVFAVSGQLPGTQPVGVTNIAGSSDQLTVQDGSGAYAGQIGLVTNCASATSFVIFSNSGPPSNINVIHHDQGGPGPGNAQANFTADYPVGSLFVPMQQEVFYVGQSTGGQSALYAAAIACGRWQGLSALTQPCSNNYVAPQPLVPGVDNMQVLYGVGANGTTSQWVPASLVSNWAQVNAVRLGFLLEAEAGSAPAGANPAVWNVLGTIVTVPKDTRLRHVYVFTVNIRNATL